MENDGDAVKIRLNQPTSPQPGIWFERANSASKDAVVYREGQ